MSYIKREDIGKVFYLKSLERTTETFGSPQDDKVMALKQNKPLTVTKVVLGGYSCDIQGAGDGWYIDPRDFKSKPIIICE